jgi:M6 family metalloprotease-like protein
MLRSLLFTHNKKCLFSALLTAVILQFLLIQVSYAQNRTIKEYKILAVMVDFPYEEPDHYTTTGRGVFDLRNYYTDPKVRNEYYHPWDIPPHDRKYFENHLEALKNYWETVSEGRVSITFDVWLKEAGETYTMSKLFWQYGNGRSKEQTNSKLAELLQESLSTCKSREGGKIDFSKYDTFMVIHPGIGRETSDGLNDIPSAYLSSEDIGKYISSTLTFDGKTIDNGIIVPEMSSSNGIAGLNGIMAQMFGFRLGLPSFSNNKDGIPAAGGWCLMDTGAMSVGYNTLAYIPTHPDAWSKIKLGWIEPVTVLADTVLDIAATHIDNGLPRAVKVPINEHEYLLIENRFNYAPRDSLPEGIVFSDSDSSGVWMKVPHYDAYIPGKGILVWHVNDSIISQHSADNTVNDDPYRRGLDLLEADGRQDIGMVFGFGDPRADYSNGYETDTFKKNGSDTLSPSTNPNSGSMWGASTGITIKVESETSEIMRVSISFTNKVKGYPLHIAGAEDIIAADLNGDNVDEVMISHNGNYTLISGDKTYPVDSAVRPSLSYSGAGLEVTLFGIRNGKIVNYHFRDNAIETNEICPVESIADSVEYNACSIFTGSEGDGKNIFFYREINSSGIPGISYIGVFNPVTSSMSRLIASNDTSRVLSASTADGYVSLLLSDNTLKIVNLSDKSISRHILTKALWHGPVMADIDRDNKYEAIVSGGGKIIVCHIDGSSESYISDGTMVGSPALADIDGDGYPEIIQCTEKNVFAYKTGGVIAEHFPLKLLPGDITEKITSSPVIADMNNDGVLDIAFATSDYRLVSINVLGIPTYGYPVNVTGTVNSSPCLFKIAPDGETGVAFITDGGNIAAYSLKKNLNFKKSPWPMSMGGPGQSSSVVNGNIPSPLKTTAGFEFYCYPNPITGSEGTFRIIPSGTTDCTITLYTADGRQVFNKHIDAVNLIPALPNEVRIDTSDLSSGLYIAKIETKQKTIMYKIGVMK